MGFFKNIGATMSPMYMEFLAAKKKLHLPNGSIVLNMVIENLFYGGFVTEKEYLEVKNKHGMNWGTRFVSDPQSGNFLWAELLGANNEGQLKLTRHPIQYFDSQMIKFMEAMGHAEMSHLGSWHRVENTEHLRVNKGVDPNSNDYRKF